MLVILALVNTGLLISKVWASNPLEPIHYHMAFTAYGGVQRFTTKGWTETAIMLCKLNKSL